MYSARWLILGLWTASAGGLFGLTGCEKEEPANKPVPPAVVPAKPAPPPAKPADVPKETTIPAVKAVEKPAPPPAEPLPPDLIQIKAEITRTKAQIDMTVAKLEVLVASTGDLDKPSDEATSAIQALDADSKGLMKRGDEMKQLGAAYFDAWEKQLSAMSTASVKKIGTERKAELSGKYADLLTAMQEARAAFDPFWADMQAINTSIEDGLAPATLKELAPRVNKVKSAASLLKGRLDAVYARVDQVGAIYAQKQ